MQKLFYEYFLTDKKFKQISSHITVFFLTILFCSLGKITLSTIFNIYVYIYINGRFFYESEYVKQNVTVL